MPKKDYSIVEKWDDDYSGAAIYSLVDKDGKRYVGQAKNLQNRLNTHRAELARVYHNPNAYTCEGRKLAEAAIKGTKFRVEVLEKIPWSETTVNHLLEREEYWLQKYGGLEGTYNSACIPTINWWWDGNNEVELKLSFDEEDIVTKLNQTDDKQGYIKELIRADIAKDGDVE